MKGVEKAKGKERVAMRGMNTSYQHSAGSDQFLMVVFQSIRDIRSDYGFSPRSKPINATKMR